MLPLHRFRGSLPLVAALALGTAHADELGPDDREAKLLAPSALSEARPELEARHASGTATRAEQKQLAAARFHDGAPRKAVLLAAELVETHPDDADARYLYATLLEATGDLSRAKT